jgi:hypothetical protein
MCLRFLKNAVLKLLDRTVYIVQSDTVSEICQDNVLLHLGNNSYANAPQCHVTRATPTLLKIQAATLPQPIRIRPIFIRHLSRNDRFQSLPSNNLAS